MRGIMLKVNTDQEYIYTINEIRERLEPIFRENNVKKAALFGSYAVNTAHGKSDVDILVDCSLRGMRFCGLAYDVSEALSKDADVYDVYYLDDCSSMKAEITRHGVTIYESK
jgi:predicted nucleotidyltransferase